jgi:hypothetical protein
VEFIDAEYIPTTGGGRQSEPNPYTDVINAIALKKDEKGKPVAKAVVLTFDPKDPKAEKSVIEAAKRRLSKAGEVSTPNVTTHSKATPIKDKGKVVPGKVLLTFWTGPKQTRPRKSTPETNINPATV